MATIAELKARLTADVGEFVAGMATANSTLAGFMAKVPTVSTGLLAVGTAAVLIGRQALDMGMQYDSALDSIQTKTGATGTELQSLGETARAVFRSIPTDLQSAADAVGTVNQRLGLTGTALQTVSIQMLELSRITGTDLQTNINSAADALIKWNVPAAEIPGTLDMIFRASQQSGASFSTLADLVTRNAAALQQFGFTLPEAIALLASLEASGVNTEQAMMGLKTALANFAAAGVTDAKAALAEVFDRIKNAPTDIEATSIAVETFGQRAGPELATAIRSGRLDLDSMLSLIQDGQTTITGTATATNDFAEKWQILKNNLNDALIPLGTVLFGALNSLIPVMTASTQALVAMAEGFGKLPGPLQEIATGALQLLLNQLMLAPIAFDLVKSAVDRVGSAISGFGAVINTASNALSAALQAISSGFSTMVSDVTAKATGLQTSVQQTFVSLWLNIKSTAGQIYTDVKSEFENAKTSATNLTSDLATAVGSKFIDLWNSVKGTATLIKNSIVTEFQNAKTTASQAVTELANSVVGTLMGLVSTAYSMASAVGGAIGSGLKAGIEGMIDEVIGAAQGLLDAAMGILSHVPGFSPIEHVGKYFGGQLGGGFAKGIEAMERRVGGASDALVAAAMAPLDASVSTSGGIGAALGGASSGNTYVSISLKSQELIDLIRNAEAGGSFAMNFGSELGLYTGTP